MDITLTCNVCGDEYNTRKTKSKASRYCSVECRQISRLKIIKKTCQCCKIDFFSVRSGERVHSFCPACTNDGKNVKKKDMIVVRPRNIPKSCTAETENPDRMNLVELRYQYQIALTKLSSVTELLRINADLYTVAKVVNALDNNAADWWINNAKLNLRDLKIAMFEQ